MESKKAIVIGAGISGLTAAWSLKKQGYEVKIIDKKSRTGGVVDTYSDSGFKAESGTNCIMVHSQQVLDFLDEVGMTDEILEIKSSAKKRFIVKDGKILAVPTNPISAMLSRIFTFKGKCRIFKEALITPSDYDTELSVAEFASRRFGNEVLDYAFDPFMTGVYAGNLEKLSARWALPKLWSLEQKYGSIIKGAIKSMFEKGKNGGKFKTKIISFKHGMNQLASHLSYLMKDDISIDCKVLSVDYDQGKWNVVTDNEDSSDTYDKMILAVPAYALKSLPLPGNASLLLDALNKIEYAPIASVTFGFEKNQISHPLDGFGVLIPSKENMSILGSLFVSSMFDGKAPSKHATLTTYIGGMRNPELVEKDIPELCDIAYNDLQKLLGINGKPIFQKVFKWKKGIAQYNLGYGAFVECIDEFEHEFPNIKLIGSYRGGIGIGSCIENALKKVRPNV